MKKLKKVPRWTRSKKFSSPQKQAQFFENRDKKLREKMEEELVLKAGNVKSDKVDFGEWRKLYYKEKLGLDVANSDLSSIFEGYIHSFYWIFKYYYQGCPSWNWYYPFFYAPLASGIFTLQK